MTMPVPRSATREPVHAVAWLALAGFIALTALVSAGVAVYGVACFLTGAFVLDDLKILMKRRAQGS